MIGKRVVLPNVTSSAVTENQKEKIFIKLQLETKIEKKRKKPSDLYLNKGKKME